MIFAEHRSLNISSPWQVQVKGVDKLKKLYGVTKEPAIVFVKEKEAKPLIYSGKMTHARLQHLFQRHQ